MIDMYLPGLGGVLVFFNENVDMPINNNLI